MKGWVGPFGPAGAVQAKVADAKMAEKLSFEASMGHSCGLHFRAAQHTRKHPSSRWAKPFLKDLPSQPWTLFTTVAAPDRI